MAKVITNTGKNKLKNFKKVNSTVKNISQGPVRWCDHLQELKERRCGKEIEINNFEISGENKKLVRGKVTIGSGAGESVWPAGELGGPDDRGQASDVGFIAANGSKMPNLGKKKVVFKKNGQLRRMGFQCSDVRKPLGAVSRICEKGNIVQFGPKGEQCFIQNLETREKMFMKLERGTYVVEVDFVFDEHLKVNTDSGFIQQA